MVKIQDLNLNVRRYRDSASKLINRKFVSDEEKSMKLDDCLKYTYYTANVRGLHELTF
jgi:hypothetical protein